MLTYLNKDITTVDRGIIAQGVNCQGAMGSGVAKAILDKWPRVYEEYKKQPTGRTMLGIAHLINIDPGTDNLFVANCYTQLFYGKNGRFADVGAIEQSLWKVYEWADYFHLDVYMPKIGAGLGGLNWEREVVPVVEYADSKWCRSETYICVWGD